MSGITGPTGPSGPPGKQYINNYSISISSNTHQQIAALFEHVASIQTINIIARGKGTLQLVSPHIRVEKYIETENFTLFQFQTSGQNESNAEFDQMELISVATKPDEGCVIDSVLIQVIYKN